MRLPALMYHDVIEPGRADDSGFAGAAAAHYKLTVADFDSHLARLAASRLRFPPVTSLLDASRAACLLTFDDGGASASRVGAQLAGQGMVGHFFITTQRIGTPGFVSVDDVLALRRLGQVVGSHSHTHPANIANLGDAALAAQWRDSRDHLQQILSEPVIVASVPGGFYTRRVAQAAAAAGYRYLFTSEPTTRTQMVDGCHVLGRYALWHDTPADTALALATDAGAQRLRQWLTWNLKKPLKRWTRPIYQRLRRHWLGET
ncbi:MAG TPA: polysaccharide deacetylase family protein [Dyella sp.]|uniref:polysaccharide deacetylase family protein n=1 Tax=Dyella sp. TaxID=1869338 RepID=UPI002D76DFE5|nr:polysaccharide deacetylase family protein [Dyella sp.]HET6554397.1 polysaccharide deacetylase family protein [Dyella sp.]